jgi:hypothetical protein
MIGYYFVFLSSIAVLYFVNNLPDANRIQVVQEINETDERNVSQSEVREKGSRMIL